MIDKEFYLKHGLLYGVISIVYLMVTYYLGIEAMASGWNSIAQLVMFFGLFYYFGVEARKLSGGYLGFSEAFKALFMVLALGVFIYILFYFILYTVIDPTLMERLMDFGLEKQLQELDDAGASEETIDQMIQGMDMMKGFMGKLFSLGGFLLMYVLTLLIGSIGLAITAAVVKKNNPNPFAEVEN